MKNRSVSLCLLTATLFAFPALAADQPAETPPASPAPARDADARREKFMQRFDQDKDGKLSDAERQAAREQMRKNRAQSGRHHARGDQARENLKKRFDRDGDGQLDRAEKREAKKALKKMRHKFHRTAHRYRWHEKHFRRGFRDHGFPFAGGAPARQALLKRFDQDGDGRLGAGERRAVQEAWRQFLEQAPKTGQ